jgi:maleate cis-trans isomerase
MLAELKTDLLVDRRNIPFTLDKGIAHRAALGLIVLATDHTIEHEWRTMLTGIDGVAFYESRLWNSASITPETLVEMEPMRRSSSAPASASTSSASPAPPARW